jgi:hypothetical protein
LNEGWIDTEFACFNRYRKFDFAGKRADKKHLAGTRAAGPEAGRESNENRRSRLAGDGDLKSAIASKPAPTKSGGGGITAG